MKMKVISSSKVIGYWATTTVIGLELLAGGVTDLVHGGTGLFTGEPVVLVLAHLGYPVYVLTILGMWKLLGAIALLVSRFPRLKEWAYVGTFFELTDAARGDDIGTVIWLLAFTVLVLASWALRPPRPYPGSSLSHSEARVVHQFRLIKPPMRENTWEARTDHPQKGAWMDGGLPTAGGHLSCSFAAGRREMRNSIVMWDIIGKNALNGVVVYILAQDLGGLPNF